MIVSDLLTTNDEHLILSQNVPPIARGYIQRAIDNYEDTGLAESLLLKAYQLAPDELDIYISIYKFYFYKKHFNSAEHFANLTLTVAARLGNIEAEWQKLDLSSCDWFSPNEAQRVFLYTMKALGFIYLRTERLQQAETILLKLQELDKDDLVGGSVVMSLAKRLLETEDAIAA